MDPKIIDEFLRKVWFTRKSRIEAAERLSAWDVFFQFLFVYYSLWLVALSILELFLNRKSLTIMLLISSIVLFGISQFVAARNFRGRADLMKTCYIELDSLYIKLQLLKQNLIPCQDAVAHFVEIETQYRNLLNKVENHSVYDYYTAHQNSDEPLSSKQLVQLYIYKSGIFAFKSILLVVPFVVLSFVWGVK